MTLLTTPKALADTVARVKLAADPKSSFATNAGIRFYVAGDASETYLEAATHESACRRHHANDAMNLGELDAVVHVADVEKALKVLAKADELAVRANDDGSSVTFSDGDRGTRKLHAPTLPRKEWPEVSYEQGDQLLTGTGVREPMLRALRFASSDETRPQLCAVALDMHPNEGAHLVATDSYRLYLGRTGGQAADVDEAVQHVFPHRAIAKVAKNLKGASEFTLHAPANGQLRYVAEIDGGREQWAFRPVEGRWPNWRQLMPNTTDVTLKVERAELVDAAKAAQLVGRANIPLRLNVNGAVKVKIDPPDSASYEQALASANVSYASDMIADAHDGDGLDYGFNPDFMLDCARSTGEGDELTIMLIAPHRPALILAGDDRSLLMPIRINA